MMPRAKEQERGQRWSCWSRKSATVMRSWPMERECVLSRAILWQLAAS